MASDSISTSTSVEVVAPGEAGGLENSLVDEKISLKRKPESEPGSEEDAGEEKKTKKKAKSGESKEEKQKKKEEVKAIKDELMKKADVPLRDQLIALFEKREKALALVI